MGRRLQPFLYGSIGGTPGHGTMEGVVIGKSATEHLAGICANGAWPDEIRW